jgi:hypothetical protein
MVFINPVGMSAIRPPVPSPLFPSQTPPSPAQSSRSAFFQAALSNAAAAPVPAAVPTVVTASRDIPVRSVTPRAGEGDPAGRLSRPGSLLDIRV